MQFHDHVLRLAVAACKAIDLQQHQATHPRLGAVDHIVCHPLSGSSANEQAQSCTAAAADMARGLAAGLAQAQPDLPVMLYGAASADAARLQDVRRACGVLCSSAITPSLGAGVGLTNAMFVALSLVCCAEADCALQLCVIRNRAALRMDRQRCGCSAGYFAPSGCAAQWHGVTGIRVGRPADLGPQQPHPRLGICTIGAAPWITNFNVLLDCDDMATGVQTTPTLFRHPDAC